jgi:hypothetical protein
MASDGALVLMAHLRFPAHIGVWLAPEGRVIHCSEQHGVRKHLGAVSDVAQLLSCARKFTGWYKGIRAHRLFV